MPESHLNQAVLRADLPAAAATAAQDQVIDPSPIKGKVTRVALVPEAAVAANATNFRTFRVVNRGQNGTGTTVVATLATSATSLVAFDEIAVPLTADTTVNEGDVLVADETVAGTGVAHSGYRIQVEIQK